MPTLHMDLTFVLAFFFRLLLFSPPCILWMRHFSLLFLSVFFPALLEMVVALHKEEDGILSKDVDESCFG